MVSNGQLPDSWLVAVGGHQLRPEAAKAWNEAVATVQVKYGWTPTLTDGYRDLATQRSLFLSRYTPQKSGVGLYNDVRNWNGTRYIRISGSGSAAVPGTSNHGWGTAIDVGNGVQSAGTRWNQWASVAQPLGWSWAEGSSVNERWHWTLPGVDTVSAPVIDLPPVVAPPSSQAPQPIEQETEEVTMYVVNWVGHNKTYTVIPGRAVKHHANSTEAADALHDARQSAPYDKDDGGMQRVFWNNAIDLKGADPLAVLNALGHGTAVYSAK